MTETVAEMQPTLYIVHEIIYRQGRPIICCDAYAEDGERVCRFDADDPRAIHEALTADADRMAALAERFPDGYETVILGDDERLPAKVWEQHVRRFHDPRLWDDKNRKALEHWCGPIDDEQEETFLSQLIEGGPF